MLRAWLRGQFPACPDVEDIIQEAFVRVIRVHERERVDSPKALLFATARNLMLMRIRHQRVERTDSLTESDAIGILDESVDIPGAVARSQELELLTKAIQSLPKRCRQIVTLRKIYGLSQRETAARLGLSEHTVETQSSIGLDKIMDFFRRFEKEGKGHA